MEAKIKPGTIVISMKMLKQEYENIRKGIGKICPRDWKEKCGMTDNEIQALEYIYYAMREEEEEEEEE